MTRCSETHHWALLAQDHQHLRKHFSLTRAFEEDPQRFERFSIQAPHVFIDYSKNLINAAVMQHLGGLAEEMSVPQFLSQMMTGHPLNVTEGRAVLHTALRGSGDSNWHHQARQDRQMMLDYVEQVHAQGVIRDVVNIGIGGSDLGPEMVAQALKAFSLRRVGCHFVSNVDAHQIQDVLEHLDPASTLFVVSSKTFTTQETLSNLMIARNWSTAAGVSFAQHFVAVTSERNKAQALGFETIFSFSDWVGGRFSVWSNIGCVIAMVLGVHHFEEFLVGAAEMDEHVQVTPVTQNAPMILALMDLWYRNFYAYTSRCVVPYHARLNKLPAYLQQLEMESNGKSINVDGLPVDHHTSPVIWGEPGSNAQHSFFQLLHQGTEVIPVEFILIAQARHTHDKAHQHTLINAIAQAQALMVGKTFEEAYSESVQLKEVALAPNALAPHRMFGGNRPSTTMILDDLTPRSLGSFMAMYEHRVAILGALWGINSFDQWGVELGKQLANSIEGQLSNATLNAVDGSTEGLLRKVGLL